MMRQVLIGGSEQKDEGPTLASLVSGCEDSNFQLYMNLHDEILYNLCEA